MTRQEIEKALYDIVFKQISDKALYDENVYKHLNLGTRFVEDLGVDSLDAVELAMDVEDEFEIPIPDEQFEKWHNIGEVLDYVCSFSDMSDEYLGTKERTHADDVQWARERQKEKEPEIKLSEYTEEF